MTTLEVLECGPGVTVQDAGRVGYRRFGVSSAGAMDRPALALANALVGNVPDAAALEVPFLGARFRMLEGTCRVSAVGAGASLAIDGRAVPPMTSAVVRPGEIVAIGPARGGVYTYLAVAGGIALPADLGSRSSHLRTGFGPAALAPGATLPLTPPDGPAEALTYGGAAAPGDGPLRVVAGPQEEHFGPEAWNALLTAEFRIGPRSDRMGLRLDGPRLVSARGYDIVSEGVVPGSLQVPGDGRAIVLGRDCQTTGGYPKIATVISADLGRLAQTPLGAPVRFCVVSPEAAVDAARRMAAWQGALAAALRPARTMLNDLTGTNLISGVTDPRHH